MQDKSKFPLINKEMKCKVCPSDTKSTTEIYQRGCSGCNQTCMSSYLTLVWPSSAATSLLRHPENLCKVRHNQLNLSHCVRSLHDHLISVSSFTHKLRLLPAVQHLSPIKKNIYI